MPANTNAAKARFSTRKPAPGAKLRQQATHPPYHVTAQVGLTQGGTWLHARRMDCTSKHVHPRAMPATLLLLCLLVLAATHPPHPHPSFTPFASPPCRHRHTGPGGPPHLGSAGAWARLPARCSPRPHMSAGPHGPAGPPAHCRRAGAARLHNKRRTKDSSETDGMSLATYPTGG